jgi:CHASE3 domain sensor protein
MEFRHPKYYKELERIRKEFEDEQKQKASSNKRQAASHKQQAIQETVPYNDIEEAQAACQPEPDITEDS